MPLLHQFCGKWKRNLSFWHGEIETHFLKLMIRRHLKYFAANVANNIIIKINSKITKVFVCLLVFPPLEIRLILL